jgi:hypothetical protein
MWGINRDHYLVARLGQDGPILDSTRLDGFWIQAAVESYIWIIERYSDGSAMWENRLVSQRVPSSVGMLIQVLAAGVTLDDMTTERWVNATDLNALGEYNFRLIVPASTPLAGCHIIRAYQDGVCLGESYYAGHLFPEE